jgi:hypothetical protein
MGASVLQAYKAATNVKNNNKKKEYKQMGVHLLCKLKKKEDQ